MNQLTKGVSLPIVNSVQAVNRVGRCSVSSPVAAAMELSQPFLSRLRVQGVHVLCDQPVDLSPLLPPLQGPVGRVGPTGGEQRPPDEVSGPVALPGSGAADELGVLHGPSVGARVQPDSLRAVVGYPGLRGHSCAADDKQTLGPGHEVLQQLHGEAVGGATGGDEGGHPRGDRGPRTGRSCVECEDPPLQPHLLDTHTHTPTGSFLITIID